MTNIFSHITNIAKNKITFVIITSLLAIPVFFSSCSNNATPASDNVDSLRTIIKAQQEQITMCEEFTDAICTSMDSILKSNNYIFKSTEGVTPSREKLTENLNAFKEIINTQRNRLSQLQEQLNNTNAEWSAKMKAVVEQMNSQLQEKDAEIEKLSEKIKDQNININELIEEISGLKENVDYLEKQNESQKQIINAQASKINEGFYVIGTKKELSSKGLLASNGFLTKKKLNLSQASTANFTKIDIREKTIFEIPGKSAKILTQAPADTYKLTSDGKQSTLTITNVTKFWSMSKYLVIQY